MRLVTWNGIPGQKIEVVLDPEAFPYRVIIDGQEEKLWPTKIKEGNELKAKAEFTIPENLGAGSHPVVLKDGHGPRQIGYVRIPDWAISK